MKGRFTFRFYRIGSKKKKKDTSRLKIEDNGMADPNRQKKLINVNKFILLLKQTKLVPAPKINEIRTIVKKINKGAKLNVKQQKIYGDIATKASIDPLTHNMAISMLTRQHLKKMKEKAGK
jgi:hypothetical protein